MNFDPTSKRCLGKILSKLKQLAVIFLRSRVTNIIIIIKIIIIIIILIIIITIIIIYSISIAHSSNKLSVALYGKTK